MHPGAPLPSGRAHRHVRRAGVQRPELVEAVVPHALVDLAELLAGGGVPRLQELRREHLGARRPGIWSVLLRWHPYLHMGTAMRARCSPRAIRCRRGREDGISKSATRSRGAHLEHQQVHLPPPAAHEPVPEERLRRRGRGQAWLEAREGCACRCGAWRHARACCGARHLLTTAPPTHPLAH